MEEREEERERERKGAKESERGGERERWREGQRDGEREGEREEREKRKREGGRQSSVCLWLEFCLHACLPVFACLEETCSQNIHKMHLLPHANIQTPARGYHFTHGISQETNTKTCCC